MSTKTELLFAFVALLVLLVTACGAPAPATLNPGPAAPGQAAAQPFDPSLVIQGSTESDCWLEAALHSLARTRPEVLQERIRPDSLTSAYVGLNSQAGDISWVSVSLDPNDSFNHDIVAGTFNWPGAVEAAWPQTVKSNLNGGRPGQGFAAFGRHYQEFTKMDTAILMQSDTSPVVACTQNSVSAEFASLHCYDVLEVTVDGQVTLYNPWGFTQETTLVNLVANFNWLTIGE